MRRDQLEHAIRTGCQISGRDEVIVVGSQAILGSLDESRLPIDATMSAEIDILPIAATDEETRALGDQTEGVAGESSTFEETHGFSIDGVDLSTSVLPRGRRTRLIKVQNENTAGSSGGPHLLRSQNVSEARILYMTTLPVAEARAQLSQLIESATTTHERFEITRNGRRAAVLLSAEDFDTMQETIDVLSDSELLRDHQAGLQAVADGDVYDEAAFTELMRSAGRLAE